MAEGAVLFQNQGMFDRRSQSDSAGQVAVDTWRALHVNGNEDRIGGIRGLGSVNSICLSQIVAGIALGVFYAFHMALHAVVVHGRAESSGVAGWGDFVVARLAKIDAMAGHA